MRDNPYIFMDDVNGTIIGPFTNPYEFWYTFPQGHVLAGMTTRLDRGFFETDEEAKEWVKEHYPEEYRHGIEMRVFDQE